MSVLDFLAVQCRMLARQPLLPLMLLALAACGGATRASNGAVPDATSAADGSPDAAGSCGSVAAYCAAHDAGCVQNWSVAGQTAPWCDDAGTPLDSRYSTIYQYAACDGYDVVLLITDGFASSVAYYYDTVTGDLAGIATAADWDPRGYPPEVPVCLAGRVGTNDSGTFGPTDCVDGGPPDSVDVYPICFVCTACSSPRRGAQSPIAPDRLAPPLAAGIEAPVSAP